jgi:hypothetical protein
MHKVYGSPQHSGDISGDIHRYGDQQTTRTFVRMYQIPHKMGHPASGGEFIFGLAGYQQPHASMPGIKCGAGTLHLSSGTGSEVAMWYDPTDRKNESRKIVFP